MCGVFGMHGAWAPEVAMRRLSAMRARLGHRGPDGAGARGGVAGGASWALGHVRLAIVAPGDGAQPMASADGRWVLSFNGAIYNHRALRRRLEAAGRRFRTRSDTEVLLQAFEQWGTGCFARIEGMYALAILDRLSGELVLARDPYGEKPLFYAEAREGLVFGSVVEAVLAGSGRSLEPDEAALADYMLFRYVPAPRTMDRRVRQVPAGSHAVWRGGALEIVRHAEDPRARAGEEAPPCPGAMRAALEASVAARLDADVPVGLFLSGGIDSAALAAMAARGGMRPDAFTVEFEGAAEGGGSELGQAAALAGRLGLRHTAVRVGPGDVMASFEEATAHRGAPLSEQNDIAMMLMARRARQDVKVVLCGEGADEVFGGYPRYRAEAMVRRAHALGIRAPGGLADRLPYGLRRASILLRALGERDAATRQAVWFGAMAPSGLAALAPGLFAGRARAVMADAGLARALERGTGSAVHDAMRFDRAVWLPDNLLARGDRMTMAAPIEMRMPYLDGAVVALAARAPEGRLVSGGVAKRLLREACADLLPAEVAGRRKRGFRTPFHDWARGPMRSFVEERLLDPGARHRRWLDAARVEAIVGEHMTRRRNHEKLLWQLLSLEVFLRQGADRTPAAEARAA